MKRSLSLVLAGVLVLGVLAGCGSKQKPGNVYTKEQPAAPQTQQVKSVGSLKIGQLPVVDGLPFWVAKEKGYYQQQGLDVELITFKSANERDAAIMGGQIDGMLADPIATTTLVASGAAKIKIASLGLGATMEEGPMAILAAPNSGITSVEQLKGVEIAISSNSVMHYVTEKLLLENGFKPEEIKVTNMASIPVRFDSLINGQIKAAILPDPLLSLAVKKGAKVILSDTKAKQNYSLSVIDFTEKALTEKAEAVKQFFIAYNRAVLDIHTNPQSFMDMLIKNGNLPAEVKDAYKILPPSPAQAPKKEDLESVVQWLLDKKIITTKVTPEQLVDASLLPTK
jgi:NitT/TauT family transport system substrate-binding protein